MPFPGDRQPRLALVSPEVTVGLALALLAALTQLALTA